MIRSSPKSRKLAWVVLGLLIAGFLALLPQLYAALWVEVPLSLPRSPAQVPFFREYENRLTGGREVRVVDAHDRTVLRFSPAAVVSIEIKPVARASKPTFASSRWRQVCVGLADGSSREVVVEVSK